MALSLSSCRLVTSYSTSLYGKPADGMTSASGLSLGGLFLCGPDGCYNLGCGLLPAAVAWTEPWALGSRCLLVVG